MRFTELVVWLMKSSEWESNDMDMDGSGELGKQIHESWCRVRRLEMRKKGFHNHRALMKEAKRRGVLAWVQKRLCDVVF